MAIKPGMKLVEIIGELIRGYKKFTGKEPAGLDLIKIKQEAVKRFEDMNKVIKVNFGKPFKEEVERMGKNIDDLPPPGSRGGPDDIAAPVMDVEDMGEGFIDFVRKTDPKGAAKLQKAEDEIRAKIEAANKRAIENLKKKKKKKDYDPEDMAQGGRAGFSEGSKSLLDLLDIQAEGSKTGKQQIPGAPEGITMDSETYNFIVNADIPIGEKINLLTKYGRGKGRTRIEKDDQELFLGEGGSRIRGIGLDINPDAEKGFGGNIMYNPDSNQVKGGITYKFNEGGRVGLKKGMDRRTFMKIMGGLTTLPILGKFAKGAKLVEPVVKKAAEITAPALDKIIEAVMSAGKLVSQSGRRLKELTTKKRLKGVEVEEDMMDGPSYTIKTKDKTIYYRPGRMDEGGLDDDIIEVIEDTVTKKAGGGIARMLGE